MEKNKRFPTKSHGTSEIVSTGSRMRHVLEALLAEAAVPRKYLIELLQLTPGRTKTDYGTIRIPYAVLPALADKAGFDMGDLIYTNPALRPNETIIAAFESMPEKARKELLEGYCGRLYARWFGKDCRMVNDRVATTCASALFGVDAERLTDSARETVDKVDMVKARLTNVHPAGISTDQLEELSMITGITMRYLLGYHGGPKITSKAEYVDDLYDVYSLCRAIMPERLEMFNSAIRGCKYDQPL